MSDTGIYTIGRTTVDDRRHCDDCKERYPKHKISTTCYGDKLCTDCMIDFVNEQEYKFKTSGGAHGCHEGLSRSKHKLVRG